MPAQVFLRSNPLRANQIQEFLLRSRFSIIRGTDFSLWFNLCEPEEESQAESLCPSDASLNALIVAFFTAYLHKLARVMQISQASQQQNHDRQAA